MNSIIQFFCDTVGSANVFRSKKDLLLLTSQSYATAAPSVLPLLACAPTQMNQAASILKFCQENRLTLRIRGGGSSLRPVSWPKKDIWILFLTTNLDRILDIDKANLTAKTQAGARGDVLYLAAKKHGLYCPLVTGYNHASTIGGKLAINAPDMQTPKYGVISNYVKNATIVIPGGNLLTDFSEFEFTPDSVKLAYGSAGRLGVIEEIVLRLLPMPQEQKTFLALYAVNQDNLEIVRQGMELAQTPPVPVSLQYLDSLACKLLGYEAKSAIAVKYEGNIQEVSDGLQMAKTILKNSDCFKEETDGIWEKIEYLPAAYGSLRKPFKREKIAFPPARFLSAIEFCNRLNLKKNFAFSVFGSLNLADLNIMIINNLPEADQNSEDDLSEIGKTLFTLELTLNNHLTDEDEIGLSREEWRQKYARQKSLNLQSQIISLFDPDNILA